MKNKDRMWIGLFLIVIMILVLPQAKSLPDILGWIGLATLAFGAIIYISALHND